MTDDCPDCLRLTAAHRRAHVVRLHAEEDRLATLRAIEDHEAATHGIAQPLAWSDAPPVSVVSIERGVVSYTFAPEPEDVA